MPYRKQGSSKKGDTLLTVAAATEITENGRIGRIRLQKVKDKSRQELKPFVLNNTEPGTIVVTDGNTSYGELKDREHFVKNLSAPGSLPAHIELPGIHRALSNCKTLFLGVYHGCRDKHLNSYLNEFEFRWNRRRHFKSNVNTLIQLCIEHQPVSYKDIVKDTMAWKRQHRHRIYRLV